MRKSIRILWLFSLLLVSCVKEAEKGEAVDPGKDNLGPKLELTLTPTLPRLSVESKVGLIPAFAFYWTGEESVSLLFAQPDAVQRKQLASSEKGCFSGLVDLSSTSVTWDDFKGIVIPADAAVTLSDQGRMESSVPTEQMQVREGEVNLSYCPFVAQMTSADLYKTDSGQYGADVIQLRSLSDLLQFRIYGAFDAGEILESVVLKAGGKSTTVTLETPFALTGRTAEDGARIYMSWASGASCAVESIEVNTDKNRYTQERTDALPEQSSRSITHFVRFDLDLSAFVRTSKEIDPQGSGTESDPYMIRTAEQWNDRAAAAVEDATGALNAAWYALGADLDFSTVTPLSFGISENAPFKGHMDGRNHTVNAFKIVKTDGTPACPFVHCTDASIKNLVFQHLLLKTTGPYCGLVGYAFTTSVEDCSLSGDVYSTGYESSNQFSYTAGIMGRGNGGLIKGCSFKGNVSAVYNQVGGIAGTVENVRITGCAVEPGSTVAASYYAGGIVASASGAEMEVSSCRSEAEVSSRTKYAGGIIALLAGGNVRDCVVSGKARVMTQGEDAGGVIAKIRPTEDVSVRRCAAYTDVAGQYDVGGFVGLVYPDAKSVTITDCCAMGGEIRSSGFNSSSYALVGGFVGFVKGNGSIVIANAAARPDYVASLVECAGGIGGFAGYNGSANMRFENCYTTVSAGDVLYRNVSVTASTLSYYGSFLGRGTNAATYLHNSYDASFVFCKTNPSGTMTDCTGLAVQAFTDGTLLARLNDNKGSYDAWVAGSDGYPVPATVPADPNPKDRSKKRVSIIGDSISTFFGWIQPGASAHYPNKNNCDVSSVDQTWWYQVVYQYMRNARVDMNISFGNTTVTQTTNASSASEYWYNQDFCTRFIQYGGVGRPDIIFIHGGTNDYLHNTGELLADGYAMRGETYPSDAEFNALFTQVDATTGISSAEALPFNTFCSAYLKLMQMVKLRYPSAKVVCIIGDNVSVGMQKSIQKIAVHYGAKVVDFLAVNGFKDKVYMTKYDDLLIHPDANGMAFMSRKIYTELGTWLEQ